MTHRFPLLIASLLTACGSGPLEPGVGHDPGTGSGTLRVDADVEATGRIPNAQAARDFDTSFHVRLEKNGQPLTTGTVIVRSEGGDVTLVFDPSDGGRWRGSQTGYFEVYQLDVVSGDDVVSDVRVDGPALHYFTAPTAGATVDASLPLTVSWASDEGATSVTLRTREIDPLAIADTRTHVLPVGSLKSKPEEVEEEELRLQRSDRVSPAGAQPGSELRVRVESRIELLVAPTGL